MVSNWTEYSLGELGFFKNGANFNKNDYGESYPVVSVKNLFRGRFVTTNDLDALKDGVISKINEYLIEEGDIVFARSSVKRSGAGQVAIVGKIPDNCIFSGFTIRFRLFDSSKVNPMFLLYLFKSPIYRELFTRIATGTTISNLSQQVLSGIKVRLPEKGIQDLIAKQFDDLDTKSEFNGSINQTLEQMAQALFKSWFVDFDPVFDNALASGIAVNDFPEALQKKALSRQQQRQQVLQQIAKGEPSADTKGEAKPLPEDISQLFPSEFEQTDEPSIGINGWIPKGWVLSNTDEEFGIKGGSTPSTKNPDFWEGGEIHWTSPKDLSGNDSKILLDTNRKITKAGLAKITSGLLPVDTVLMSSRAPVGYLAFAKVPVAINQGYIALLCKKTLSPEYTMQFLNSVMDEIKGISGGTTFAEISKKTFRSIKLIVPSKSVVDAYSSIAKAQYDKITENIKQSNTLTDTRDYLLPKLISGEIQLDDASTF